MTLALDAESTGGWCLPEAQLAIAGIQVARTIYDTLTMPGADGKIHPYLAQSVTGTANNTIWTIKLRPGIDTHDYQVKMRSMVRFFEEGDKVKVTLRFRGREMAHQELGYKLLQRVRGDVATLARVEVEPMSEGRQIVMILAPR